MMITYTKTLKTYIILHSNGDSSLVLHMVSMSFTSLLLLKEAEYLKRLNKTGNKTIDSEIKDMHAYSLSKLLMHLSKTVVCCQSLNISSEHQVCFCRNNIIQT